jgi:plasmid stabilization system protein ParE
MIALNYTPGFWQDMARITDFLISSATDATQALNAYDIITHGIQTLIKHPEIGRASTSSRFRELVISHGNTGYIALYSYNQFTGIVTLIAIRHQRESGFH